MASDVTTVAFAEYHGAHIRRMLLRSVAVLVCALHLFNALDLGMTLTATPTALVDDEGLGAKRLEPFPFIVNLDQTF